MKFSVSTYSFRNEINQFDAISAAKEYISGALASMMDLGHGSGPLNHAYRI